MKHIEFRELIKKEFQFNEGPDPKLMIKIPECVQDDGWTVLPVMATNIVSCIVIVEKLLMIYYR